MGEDKLKEIRKEYQKKYNSLEIKMVKSNNINDKNFIVLEKEQDKIDIILDLLDDALDAYNENDEEDIKIIEDELNERIGDAR